MAEYLPEQNIGDEDKPMPDSHKYVHYHWIRVYINHAHAEIACVGIRYSLFQKQKENHLQQQ